MKRISSVSGHHRSLPALLRNATIALAHRAKSLALLFEAVIGELRRLNALGSENAKLRTRGERAASVRKALAERYREHSRCC